MSAPVVTATHTIMDGLVLRWYASLAAAEYGGRECLSASRNGVMIHGNVYLHDLPDEWVEAARRAHELLRAGKDAEARKLATHEAKGFTGDLVAISG